MEGVWKIGVFRPISRCISKTVKDTAIVTIKKQTHNGRRIGTRLQSTESAANVLAQSLLRCPTSQRQAVVTARLKKPSLNPDDLNSYRPIYNLSFLSKLIERAVATMQFMAHSDSDHLITSKTVCLLSALLNWDCCTARLQRHHPRSLLTKVTWSP